MGDRRLTTRSFPSVVPAKAGIHLLGKLRMDSRFRGNDGQGVCCSTALFGEQGMDSRRNADARSRVKSSVVYKGEPT
jgi:hypothetical protein